MLCLRGGNTGLNVIGYAKRRLHIDEKWRDQGHRRCARRKAPGNSRWSQAVSDETGNGHREGDIHPVVGSPVKGNGCPRTQEHDSSGRRRVDVMPPQRCRDSVDQALRIRTPSLQP